MRARDVMTAGVRAVRAEAGIDEAIKIMLGYGLSGVPVVDDAGVLQGIVTEGDLLRRSELETEKRRSRFLQFFLSPGSLADEYVHTRGRKVKDVMTRSVVTVTEDASLQDIVDKMTERRIKRLPVVRGTKVVGIVSRADVLRALGERSKTAASEPSSDAEIKRRILAEFERAAFIPRGLIDVSVADGVVELCGCITDERERDAVRVAVENAGGVRAIRDHLTWVEPMSGMVFLSPEDEKDASSRAA